MGPSTGAEWWRPQQRSGPGWSGTAAGPVPDSPIPFAALLVFTIVLLLAPQAFVPGLGRVRLALLMGAFAIAAHCWTRFAAGQPLTRRSREMWLAGALFGWAVVTHPLSQWPAWSTPILFGDYLKSLGVFWLLSNAVTTPAQLRTVAWVLSLTAVPIAVTGVRNFLSGHLVGGRIVSFEAAMTSDPNALAMVLNLILPLTVGLLLVSRRPVVRGVLIGLIALDAGAIVVTFARGGFLTLATTFALYLRTLQKWHRGGWAIAALVLVVAAIPLLPPEYLDRLSTIKNIQMDRTGAAQERWELTRTALRYVMRHPLVGAGLGMNVIADCERRGLRAENCGRVCSQMPFPFPPCVAVHNVYLQFAMDLGWPGLGLFLLLLVSCVSTAARVRERSTGLPALRELASLAEAIRISVVGFAVAALFYPWAYFAYFYFVAALAVAAGAIYEIEARAAAPALSPQ